jgi:nicotinamidase-related amidase
MKNSALLIIDMQQAMQGSAAGSRNNPDAERNMATLLETWRNNKAIVVHVRHISRSATSPFRPGQPGCDFQTLFQPLASEHVVEKNIPDAFVNSGLERWLLAREIRSVVIVGVSTNNSVESTARTSGNLGFETFVVSDATFAFAKKDYDGVSRTAAEVHAMSLANLAGEYATIITAEALHTVG